MKPRSSRYNGALLKKFVVELKSVQVFRHLLGHSKKKKVFAVWEDLLKPGGSCDIWEMGCGVRGMSRG